MHKIGPQISIYYIRASIPTSFDPQLIIIREPNQSPIWHKIELPTFVHIFYCVTLAGYLRSSAVRPYPANISTALTFVKYVSCYQATGRYCNGYHIYGFSFQFYVYFVHLYILNICACLYFNYCNVLRIYFKYFKSQHVYTTPQEMSTF